ncbi:ribokinase [Anaerorhabdus sp.]|uniref:ribokinase n=1 Tax=Anaerorhabdus sp. TaxID=1872524 RepID=UPI002B215353|nr:ribokinase [Anaerorhabdus sp.]MEA4876266.1 ribokinase [Anaerorhabdus sp.]
MMKIGVVGSINMDLVVVTDRIPHKGETLIGNELQYNAGGKGSNQAVAIARLGGDVVMFGKVGNDDNGRKLTTMMKENGVNTDFIKIEENANTGLAVITVGEGDNTIVVLPGANSAVDIDYIESIKKELLTCGLVVLQHEIPLETNEYIIRLCKENGIKTLLNPAPAATVSEEIIDLVDFLTPNEHEAVLLFENEDVEQIMMKYPEKLIVTQGEKGISLAVSEEKIVTVPSRKSKVLDTTGAGDTFNGAFVYAYTSGMPLKEALRFANVAAGLSTEKAGAQNGMPTKEMVLKELGD